MSSELDQLTLDTVDELTESGRIALFEHLLTRIPRYHLTKLHARLSGQLRRDIVASLPQELALTIFGELENVDDLLTCASVSKRWRSLATDGELWRAQCTIDGIEPRRDTSWADVFAQRERCEQYRRLQADRALRIASSSEHDYDQAIPHQQDADQLEGWVEDGNEADERRLSLRLARDAAAATPSRPSPTPPPASHVHSGVRLGVVERLQGSAQATAGGSTSAGSALDSDIEEEDMDVDVAVDEQVPVPVMLLPRPRRPTFNTGRQQSGLPIFLLPAAGVSGEDGLSTSPKVNTLNMISTQPASSLFSMLPLSPLLSYASSPTASPRPDARHLFLTDRLLRRRFLRGRPTPRLLDGKTSLANGGLTGHSDGVYCLQLIRGRMKVYATAAQGVEEMEESSVVAAGPSSPVSTSSRPSARSPRRRPSAASFSAGGVISNKDDADNPSVTARDWLLSGSRDQTIRLWDLDGMRCVRIFGVDQDGKGHRSSVLTLHAKWVQRRRQHATTATSATTTNGARSTGLERHHPPTIESSSVDGKRLLLVAGGSDGKLVLWDVLSGKIQGEIQAHEPGDSVLCVRFDENRIVSCSKDRSIRVFDLHTLERTLVIGGAFSTVGPAAENHPLTSDIPPGGPASQLESGHKAAVNAIELVGDTIVSVSGDRCLCVWHAVTGELLSSTEDHSRGVASLALDPSNGDVVTGCSDWAIRMFKLGDALTRASTEGRSPARPSRTGLEGNDLKSTNPIRGTTFRADPACSSCRALEYGRRRMIQQQQQQRPARGGWAAPLSEARAHLLPALVPTAPQPGLDNPFVPGWPLAQSVDLSDARLGASSNASTSQNMRQDDNVGSETTRGAAGPLGPSPNVIPVATPPPPPPPPGMPLLACEQCQLKTHRNLVRSLWLGRDVVVSGSYDAKVKIWNRHTHSLIADFPSIHAGRLFSIVGDATKVVSSGIDQKIVIWDFAQGLDTSFI